jgi:hypothetical protein
MKSLLVVMLALVFAGTSQGNPTEKAILAAMKLSEKPNYSWTSTISDDASTYDIDGKTNGSWTWMRQPVVKSIARRLGRDVDTHLEALFRDSGRFVINTSQGWQMLDELPRRHRDWTDDDDLWYMSRAPAGYFGATVMPGLGSLDPFGTDLHDPFRTGPRDPFGTDPFANDPFPTIMYPAPLPRNPDATPHSNMQFGLYHPHEELAIIVSSFTDIRVQGDTVIGTLSDIGAQLLLVREGQDLNPLAAAGMFKLVIKDGMVVRYQLRLEGVFGLKKRQRAHVHQTSTTTISNIGSTAFEIPVEAWQRLGD